MNQRHTLRRFFFVAVTTVMMWSFAMGLSANEIAITVEKNILGQGFLEEPTILTMRDGDTAMDALIALMGRDRLRLDSEETYVGGMLDPSDPIAEFPQYVLDAIEDASDYEENADTMNARGRGRSGWLGEFDYSGGISNCFSGWMISVNNVFIDKGAAVWEIHDGDVLRWQYTIYGAGADVGDSYMGNNLLDFANKDALVKKIAQINQDKAAYIGNSAVKQRYYDNAIAILTTQTATQSQVNMALANLNGTSTQEPTLPDPNHVPGDAPAIAAVEAKIAAIGTVTIDSGDAIVAARLSYDSLRERLKSKVTNYATLVAAEGLYAQLAAGGTDQQAANYVMDKIRAIGTVTLAKKDVVNGARLAYNALTPVQKGMVSNYDVLVAAEDRLRQLEAEAAADEAAAATVRALINAIGEVTLEREAVITAARNAYDGLTPARKGLVGNYDVLTAAEARLAQLKAAADEAAAAGVRTLIAAIGTVTLDSGDAITAARMGYDALSDTQKALVENYPLLTAAEARLAELIAAADEAAVSNVEALIAAIGEVTLEREAAIVAARNGYDALTPVRKALVGNVAVLTAAEARLAELKAAAADEAAAGAVAALIAAIGTVDADSGAAIAAARSAYDDLNDVRKALVTNEAVLTAAEAAYDAIEQQIAAVKAAIAAIGEVTLDSKDAIDSARESYDALDAVAQKYVDNYAVLTAAETAYAAAAEKDAADRAAAAVVVDLIAAIGEVTAASGDDIAAARNGYNGLTAAQRKYVTNIDVLRKAEADLAELSGNNEEIIAATEALIDAIGEVTLAGGDAIAAARSAYDALTPRQKLGVGNYQKLVNAEGKYAALVEKDAADRAAAAPVIAAIAAIGEVTLDSEDAIAAARAAYRKLTPAQKQLVHNEAVLTAAEATLAQLVAAAAKDAADREAAAAVDGLIAAIGAATLDREAAVTAARAGYDDLTTDQRKYVTAEAALAAAEAQIAALKAEAAAVVAQIGAIGEVTLDSEATVVAARAAYDDLVPAQQTLVTNEPLLIAAEGMLAQLKAEIRAVVDSIAALGEVDLTKAAAVAAARAGYDRLNDAQKAQVDNVGQLIAAEAVLAALKASPQAVMAQIAAIGNVTLDRESAIVAARAGYDSLSDPQKALVTNVDTLVAAEKALAQLKTASAAVATQIAAIGEVTLAKEAAVVAARAAYDGLTIGQQGLVANVAALVAAEAKIATLKAEAAAVAAQIAAIGEVTKDSGDAIAAARKGYESLDGDQRKLVDNLSVLVAAEEKFAALAQPQPSPPPRNPFVDVAAGAYYRDAVLWALTKGVTEGVDATHFGPDGDCTRGQVVTFLWRAAGKPVATAKSNPFVDVKANAYYYDAVLWAVAKGVTTGADATHFDPNGKCTRGQVVTFMWRANGSPEVSADVSFSDVKAKAYYEKAVRWAVAEKITEGTGGGKFSPNNTCTRAQVVTFLWRAQK